MIKKLIISTRYLALFVAISLFFSSIILVGIGIYKTYNVIFSVFNNYTEAKSIMIDFVVSTDVFLFAIALYIMSIGLYSLFIDDTINLPNWMKSSDFTDLKKKFLNVIVLILVIDFLGKIVNWNGNPEILQFGISIGIVIATISFYRIAIDGKKDDLHKQETKKDLKPKEDIHIPLNEIK